MNEIERFEVGRMRLVAQGADEELMELGSVSEKTRGLFFGFFNEISILPLRLTL